MEQKEISAKVPGKDGVADLECSIAVDFASTVDEAIQMYGEEALLTNAFSNWRVTLQGNIRNSLKSGMTCDQIQDKLASAKMGVAVVGTKMDAQAAFIAKFKRSTPEEQAKMLEDLRLAAQG